MEKGKNQRNSRLTENPWVYLGEHWISQNGNSNPEIRSLKERAPTWESGKTGGVCCRRMEDDSQLSHCCLSPGRPRHPPVPSSASLESFPSSLARSQLCLFHLLNAELLSLAITSICPCAFFVQTFILLWSSPIKSLCLTLRVTERVPRLLPFLPSLRPPDNSPQSRDPSPTPCTVTAVPVSALRLQGLSLTWTSHHITSSLKA